MPMVRRACRHHECRLRAFGPWIIEEQIKCAIKLRGDWALQRLCELSGHRALPQNSVAAQGEYDLNSKFSIYASRWFGWQMNPGYFGERCVPYFSPIYVTRVTPLKTGKGILEMDFFNACYVEGVQNFDGMRLKVLLRAENYLIGHLLGNDPEVRSAIISHIEFAWLSSFCPHIIEAHPPSEMKALYSGSVSLYLDRIYGIRKSE
jgi:hypothetical protein